MKDKSKPKDELPFGKINYQLFGAAALLVLIGYIMMSGGGSDNPNEFNYDELFAFHRITLAPLIILGGFGVGIYAILKKPKEEES